MTPAAQQPLAAPPSPGAMGYQGEGWVCKCFAFCSVFIVGKRQSCAVGAWAICTDLVAQEVTNPAESSFTCPGISPGSSQALSPLPLPCSQQICPDVSLAAPSVSHCFMAEAGWNLLQAVAFAKPVVPSLAPCEMNLHTPCLHSCPLTAAYFSPSFPPPTILTGVFLDCFFLLLLLRKITHPGSQKKCIEWCKRSKNFPGKVFQS